MKELVMLAWLVGGLVGAGLAAPSARTDVGTQPATQRASVFSLDPSGQLAGPPGEAAEHNAHLESLRAALDAADGPLDQAAAHLAIANWLLAVPTARPATRWLIGIEQRSDLRTMADSADTAQEHLAHARTLLPPDEKAAGHDQRKRRSQLAQAADVLEPFAALFAAAGLEGDAEAQRSTYGQAALSLAALREADDADVAACALLWQSFGSELAGRRKRALISLPDALTQPEHLPYDFASRLLRCRIMADAGQHAAATALAIRMQAICQKWFPRALPHDVQARRRLIALLQYRVGRDWLEQLKASGSHAAATRLEDMLASVQATFFAADQGPGAYHLASAVPIVVQPPTVKHLIPSSAPASATAPASLPAPIEDDQESPLPSTRSSPSF